MVEGRTGQKHRLHRAHASRVDARLKRWKPLALRAQVEPRVDQKPAVAIGPRHAARGGARGKLAAPRRARLREGGVPWGEPAPRRGAEKPDADNDLRLASGCVAGALKKGRHVLEGGVDRTLFLVLRFHSV